MLFYYSETRKVGDERAIRLRNPDAYELHSVARSLKLAKDRIEILTSVPSHTLFISRL